MPKHRWNSNEARDAGRKGGAMHSAEHMRAISQLGVDARRLPGLNIHDEQRLDKAIAYAKALNRMPTVAVEDTRDWLAIRVHVADKSWIATRVWKAQRDSAVALERKRQYVINYISAKMSLVCS